MGGYGSGRYRWKGTPKGIVEDCINLSVSDFNRKGFLVPNASGTITITWYQKSNSMSWHIKGDPDNLALHFFFTVTTPDGRTEDFSPSVCFETTPLQGGKQRYWFTCPECGTRRGNILLNYACLYRGFACRECHDLAYRSTRDNRHKDKWFKIMRALERGEGVPREVALDMMVDKYGLYVRDCF